MFHHVVSESCLQDGIDPDEMQLALAISASLKDQNQPKPSEPSTSKNISFENPFASTGKVQPISAMLERFGFKCKKTYTEFEMDLITNSKVTKRSKFQKLPTALTRSSSGQRNEMIRAKVDKILESSQKEDPKDFDGRFDYTVFSFQLQELHEKFVTAFGISSEGRPTSEILMNYYVTDLFEPSFARADHLLKDWSKIPGRDPSPERKAVDSKEPPKAVDVSKEDENDSDADLFADIEDFDVNADDSDCAAEPNVKETSGELSGKLEQLRDKLTQSMVEATKDESDTTLEYVGTSPGIKETSLVGDGSESSITELENFVLENFEECESDEAEKVDLTKDGSSDDGSAEDLNEVFQGKKVEESAKIKKVVEGSPGTEEVAAGNQFESKKVGGSADIAKAAGENQFPIQISLISSDEEEEGRSFKFNAMESKSFAAEASKDLMEVASSDSVDMLEISEPKNHESNLEEKEKIDLTQADTQGSLIPFDDSYFSLQQHMKQLDEPSTNSEDPTTSNKSKSPIQVSLISSDDEATAGLKLEKSFDESDDDLFPGDKEISSQNSFSNDEDFVIDISDEEINYSIKKFHNNNEDPSEASSGAGDDAIDLTQANDKQVAGISYLEVDNRADFVMIPDDECDINDTITELLSTSRPIDLNASRKELSMKENGMSDSIMEIMRKYGVSGSTVDEKENSRSFRRMQSDSQLVKSAKRRKSVQFHLEDDEKSLSFSQPMELDGSMDRSMENVQHCSPSVHRKRQTKPKRSLGVQLDDDYIVDTETDFPEPDYKNMTPVELKQELFKFGVRSLPVKKAVELLEFIYDQIHPKIRIAADEEIDANDSRRVMNITDIASNIGVQDDDDFVFQPGLVDDEEFMLPKVRRSKVSFEGFLQIHQIIRFFRQQTPTCAIPLHISFYNMVRSNEKLQKFILEFRPVELDQIHKHFRKFGLSYQPNDLIGFLDKRCITFKTKEKSYSKTHERKKQKRAQKQQASQRSRK